MGPGTAPAACLEKVPQAAHRKGNPRSPRDLEFQEMMLRAGETMMARVHRTECWIGRCRERMPRAAEGPFQALAEFISAQHMPMRKLSEGQGETTQKGQRGQSMSMELTRRWVQFLSPLAGLQDSHFRGYDIL